MSDYTLGGDEKVIFGRRIVLPKTKQIDMSKRIKCPVCQTWNEDRDYCSNCNEVLSHELKMEQAREKLRAEEQQRPLTQFNNYLKRLRESNSPIDKVKFTILNSAWWIFLIAVTVLIALVALAPG